MEKDNVVRLPAKCTGNGKHSKEERGPELYPTPDEVTLALLAAEPLPQRLWEPAAGMGHMARALKIKHHDVFATELHDYRNIVEGAPPILVGMDFLKADFRSLVPRWDPEAIVTNPPFSLAADFVRKGLEYAPTVYILGRLAFLEGQRRRDIIENNLARCYVFENRLPMMHRWSPDDDGNYVEWKGEKAASAMAFAWYVFERDHDPLQKTRLSRIRWEPVA